MILSTRQGNRELRFAEFGNSSDIPAPGSGWYSASGVPVSTTEALGVPAVSNVIRSPAEIIASLPYLVYEKGPVRRRAESSWQWALLHEQPSAESDTYQFFYDLALSLEATQNAFVQKAKFNGRVFELYVLDPQRVAVRRDKQTGEKRFDVWLAANEVRRDLTADEILHVRGFAPQPGAATGVSLVQLHRDPIGAAMAMQRFEGDYFRNNAQPPFWFTGATSKTQAQEMLAAHNAAHQGAGRQWRPGALWGSADIKTVPLSLEDAMFADAKRLSIEDACRIWRWPRQLLELSGEGERGPVDENAWTARFLKFYLLPRLKRIERAFASDRDLYPTTGVGSGRARGARLFGEFLTAALERADFVTRVRGYKDARQGSWITANEIRDFENLPPAEGGDEILITPTGSAPNPGGSAQQEPEEEPARSLNGHDGDVELTSLLKE